MRRITWFIQYIDFCLEYCLWNPIWFSFFHLYLRFNIDKSFDLDSNRQWSIQWDTSSFLLEMNLWIIRLRKRIINSRTFFRLISLILITISHWQFFQHFIIYLDTLTFHSISSKQIQIVSSIFLVSIQLLKDWKETMLEIVWMEALTTIGIQVERTMYPNHW